MDKLRAKLKVDKVTETKWGGLDQQGEQKKSAETVHLSPVYSSDPATENYDYSQATPAGKVELHITNPAAFGFFEEGKEYRLAFEPA